MERLAVNAVNQIPPRASMIRETRFAMGLSLAVGILMLAGKSASYWLTGSAAIFSDAAESVVHVAAVGFAAYSLWLSTKPPNPKFPYGYEKISYFSAGFEGALIILAAGLILYHSISRWLAGPELARLGLGTVLIGGAALVNAALGTYLISKGKKNNSLILEANGRHVLTDSWTSFGVVGGLCLVLLTGWKPFDSLLAIAVAVNILWSGKGLVRKSFAGLMDVADPELGSTIREQLDRLTAEMNVGYHGVRFRHTGISLWIEFELQFPGGTAIQDAHRVATNLERKLKESLPLPAEVLTHLESAEDHAFVHEEPHYEGKPGLRES